MLWKNSFLRKCSRVSSNFPRTPRKPLLSYWLKAHRSRARLLEFTPWLNMAPADRSAGYVGWADLMLPPLGLLKQIAAWWFYQLNYAQGQQCDHALHRGPIPPTLTYRQLSSRWLSVTLFSIAIPCHYSCRFSPFIKWSNSAKWSFANCSAGDSHSFLTLLSSAVCIYMVWPHKNLTISRDWKQRCSQD